MDAAGNPVALAREAQRGLRAMIRFLEVEMHDETAGAGWRHGMFPLGQPALEAVLWAGVPRGASVEFCGVQPAWPLGLAIGWLSQAQAEGGIVAIADPFGELPAVALASRGVDPARTLVLADADPRGLARALLLLIRRAPVAAVLLPPGLMAQGGPSDESPRNAAPGGKLRTPIAAALLTLAYAGRRAGTTLLIVRGSGRCAPPPSLGVGQIRLRVLYSPQANAAVAHIEHNAFAVETIGARSPLAGLRPFGDS
ncbi:MAG: hypothetical protein C4523_08705 [Myxococcales bacterium]|nr:MAG: hypothetical protein C4523_08705 [Myxococcales bacterium]